MFVHLLNILFAFCYFFYVDYKMYIPLTFLMPFFICNLSLSFIMKNRFFDLDYFGFKFRVFKLNVNYPISFKILIHYHQ